jgi:hypothetical protein
MMADEDRFEIGKCYFLIGYYDPRFTLPRIRTLIFTGKKQQNGSEFWCFGTPETVDAEGKVEVDQDDILQAPKELLRSIHDWNRLIEELTENKRAQDHGEVFQGVPTFRG